MAAHALQKVSKSEQLKAHHRLQGLRHRMARIRKDAEKSAEKVFRTVEVVGMAGAMGLMVGRSAETEGEEAGKGPEVLGVPLELAAGVGLCLLGYFNVAGKASHHLNNLGDGALAAYLATLGEGLGAEWAKPAPPKP